MFKYFLQAGDEMGESHIDTSLEFMHVASLIIWVAGLVFFVWLMVKVVRIIIRHDKPKSGMPILLASVALLSSCNKADRQPEPTYVKLAKSEAFINFAKTLKAHGEFAIKNNSAENQRIDNTDQADVEEFARQEGLFMEQIKKLFDRSDLTEENFKRAFNSTFSTINDYAAPADPCNGQRNEDVNDCWEEFGWNCFFNMLKGPLAWGTAIDNIHDFTNCNRKAEKAWLKCEQKTNKPDGVADTTSTQDTAFSHQLTKTNNR